MTKAPRTAPGIVPMPPANEVPPMTAAAMTYSSSSDADVERPPLEPGGRDRGGEGAEDAHQDEGLA